MTSYEIGLAVHILGVMIFSGGALLAGVGFETARRRARPSEVALLLGLTRIGALIVVAGAVLVLGAGLWLAGEVDQFGEAWLLTSLGLFVAALVLGALGGQRPKHARLVATRLVDNGDEMTPELRRLLDDPASRIANYGSSLLVVVILVLMVWQPGR
ncbi:MAG TPA: DUF2269 family protein [Gaiellaceae bacterium]|nr:DUF2269 family protein [Gaiellaceae bacterium]